MRGSKSTIPNDQNSAEPNSSPLPAQSAPSCSLRTDVINPCSSKPSCPHSLLTYIQRRHTQRVVSPESQVCGHGTASAGLCPLRSLPGPALPVCGPGWVWRVQEPAGRGRLSQAPAVCQTAQAEGGPCCDASKCHSLSTGRAARAGPEEQLIAQKINSAAAMTTFSEGTPPHVQ